MTPFAPSDAASIPSLAPASVALAPRLLLALASKADVAPNTVRRRLDGRPMRPSTRARVEAAARRLRLTLPPYPVTP